MASSSLQQGNQAAGGHAGQHHVEEGSATVGSKRSCVSSHSVNTFKLKQVRGISSIEASRKLILVPVRYNF